MEIIDNIAHLSCSCGKTFQVLNEEGTDWNEHETAQLYYNHLIQCDSVEDKEGTLLWYELVMNANNYPIPKTAQKKIDTLKAGMEKTSE